MNFDFSDDQKLLKEQVRKFLADKCPTKVVRRVLEITDDFGSNFRGIDPKVVTGATMFGLSMFGTLFLGVVLAVFLTLGSIRGDAERGLLQPLVVRPVGRSTLLLSRFLGAAAVCIVYVLSVYGIALAIIDFCGSWLPPSPAEPGLEPLPSVNDELVH